MEFSSPFGGLSVDERPDVGGGRCIVDTVSSGEDCALADDCSRAEEEVFTDLDGEAYDVRVQAVAIRRAVTNGLSHNTHRWVELWKLEVGLATGGDECQAAMASVVWKFTAVPRVNRVCLRTRWGRELSLKKKQEK